ncbi:hypothetical protein EGR_08781 [Echinococcus granulosus]|uniref:Uncharacterized protein n=1 Tax=Echinococcus granulosus TaxID=6210 RepID=W6U5F4_ECHGR|nr:hypothetical protein EGR_08781 [Echinococcus granulosus]EUB56355.1 hypothetical protein EGR_08781 [Echinococcus granulosus]
MSLDSSSGSAATAAPKGLTQRYTSTISLNISSSSPTPSTVNTNTNAPTIRSPKIGSDGSSRRRVIKDMLSIPISLFCFLFCVLEQGDSQHPPQNISLVPNSRHSPLLQSTIRTATASSPITPPPIHRSQSAKYCSSIPTASSAYFTGNSNTGNSTIEESDGAVISASRVMGKVEEEEEDDMFVEQRSDIDMESSGEYEREDVIALVERERNGEAKQTLEDVHKEVMHRIIFVVGKPQEPTFRLCQIICEEAPFLLTTTKLLWFIQSMFPPFRLFGDCSVPPAHHVGWIQSSVARLIGVGEKDFNNLVFSKSTWKEPTGRGLVSRHFWRYLHLRRRRLLCSSITTYSQNDSGFFEDFTNNRKRNRRIWRQDLPTHGPKNYFKRRRRKANPLGIYHFQYLKHAVPPKHHGGPKPNRDVVEVLCRRLHELCVSVVFNRLNSLLRASLNKCVSSINSLKGGLRVLFKDAVKCELSDRNDLSRAEGSTQAGRLLRTPIKALVGEAPAGTQFRLSINFNISGVLDDGRSRVVDCQPQTITLPHLSPPLSEQLTSRRHLRVLQECGLLNFAAINNTASGLTVFKADEFLRTFAVLDYLPSNEERSLKALANKLVKAGKRPCGTYLWHGTATKPLNLAFFNDKIVKIVDNCGVLSDLYFVSRDWQLKLELLKHSIASRRIQRWWRRRHEQRLILMNISNFLLHPATTATNATTVSTVNNNFNFPEAVDRRSVLPAEAGETPAYVVTNAFVSNIMMPQIYEIPQVPPHLQHQQKKSKRPPPSAGIAWFEPRHQRPPAYPPVARNERPVTLVESPGTRVLSRQHSAYGPPDMPAVNLRRSNSARSVDNHHITFVSSPIYSNEGRPLTRSSSTNVGNIGREAQGGVQRRIRHKTNDMPELGARRPVSWHVDQMEAQVSAHLEKQRLLNGGHSPVSGRRGSSAVRMAEDQRHGPRHANFENGQPRTSFNGGGGGGVFYPSLHSRSPLSAEAQREEYIRVQAEITRGEFRGSREPNSSPPGRLACAGRVEVVDSRQKDS